MKKIEKLLLEKLEKGELDGQVGNTFVTGFHKKVYLDKLIIKGIPTFRRTGESSKFFDGKENVRIPGKVVDTVCNTVSEKLNFLQKYGWLMKDPDVVKYSAQFKPKK